MTCGGSSFTTINGVHINQRQHVANAVNTIIVLDLVSCHTKDLTGFQTKEIITKKLISQKHFLMKHFYLLSV